jgi:hypothetical protein
MSDSIVYIVTFETEDANPLPFGNARRTLASAKAVVEKHAAELVGDRQFDWTENGSDQWTFTDYDETYTWNVYETKIED